MKNSRIHISWYQRPVLGVFAIYGLSILLLTNPSQSLAQSAEVPQISSEPIIRLGEQVPIDSVRELVHDDPHLAYQIITQQLPAQNDPDYNDWVFELQLATAILKIEEGDYDAGRQWSMQAIVQSRRTDQFFVNSSRAFNTAGNASSYQSMYKEAARYYYYAITMAEQDTAANDYLSKYFNNMATVLMSLNQNDRAVYYLDKAEATNIQRGAYDLLPSVYSNRGVLYSRQKMYDSAGVLYQKALELARKHNKHQSEVAALINIAATYIERGQPAQAIPYLKEVIKSDKGVNPYFKEANALYMLGVAYSYMEDYKNAEHYLKLALDKATTYGIPEFINATHAQLSDLYHQTKDWQKAFLHHQAYVNIKDSIVGKENAEAANLLEIKYRTAQKDKEIIEKQLLIREQERQLTKKNVLIGGIALGSLTIITILFGFYQKYRHRQRLQAKQIEILRREQEIGRLRAMIQGEEKERRRLARELHDGIGGTLAAVKMSFRAVQKNFSFIEEAESFNEAMHMLDIMSNELREAAHNLMPESIIQNGLPESVIRYCEQIKKGKNLNIETQIYGSFDHLEADVVISVYRIIQELLHNVVKHAKATHAIVQISLHNDLLSIVLEDNGVGFDPGWESSGIGLKNMRSRIHHMNGRMTIETTPKKDSDPSNTQSGTTIYIELDLSPRKQILS